MSSQKPKRGGLGRLRRLSDTLRNRRSPNISDIEMQEPKDDFPLEAEDLSTQGAAALPVAHFRAHGELSHIVLHNLEDIPRPPTTPITPWVSTEAMVHSQSESSFDEETITGDDTNLSSVEEEIEEETSENSISVETVKTDSPENLASSGETKQDKVSSIETNPLSRSAEVSDETSRISEAMILESLTTDEDIEEEEVSKELTENFMHEEFDGVDDDPDSDEAVAGTAEIFDQDGRQTAIPKNDESDRIEQQLPYTTPVSVPVSSQHNQFLEDFPSSSTQPNEPENPLQELVGESGENVANYNTEPISPLVEIQASLNRTPPTKLSRSDENISRVTATRVNPQQISPKSDIIKSGSSGETSQNTVDTFADIESLPWDSVSVRSGEFSPTDSAVSLNPATLSRASRFGKTYTKQNKKNSTAKSIQADKPQEDKTITPEYDLGIITEPDTWHTDVAIDEASNDVTQGQKLSNRDRDSFGTKSTTGTQTSCLISLVVDGKTSNQDGGQQEEYLSIFDDSKIILPEETPQSASAGSFRPVLDENIDAMGSSNLDEQREPDDLPILDPPSPYKDMPLENLPSPPDEHLPKRLPSPSAYSHPSSGFMSPERSVNGNGTSIASEDANPNPGDNLTRRRRGLLSSPIEDRASSGNRSTSGNTNQVETMIETSQDVSAQLPRPYRRELRSKYKDLFTFVTDIWYFMGAIPFRVSRAEMNRVFVTFLQAICSAFIMFALVQIFTFVKLYIVGFATVDVGSDEIIELGFTIMQTVTLVVFLITITFCWDDLCGFIIGHVKIMVMCNDDATLLAQSFRNKIYGTLLVVSSFIIVLLYMMYGRIYLGRDDRSVKRNFRVLAFTIDASKTIWEKDVNGTIMNSIYEEHVDTPEMSQDTITYGITAEVAEYSGRMLNQIMLNTIIIVNICLRQCMRSVIKLIKRPVPNGIHPDEDFGRKWTVVELLVSQCTNINNAFDPIWSMMHYYGPLLIAHFIYVTVWEREFVSELFYGFDVAKLFVIYYVGTETSSMNKSIREWVQDHCIERSRVAVNGKVYNATIFINKVNHNKIGFGKGKFFINRQYFFGVGERVGSLFLIVIGLKLKVLDG